MLPPTVVTLGELLKAAGQDTSLGQELTKDAYERLRSMIVSGRLRAKMRLSEATVAETLGLSRSPVRHALSWLHREGFLVQVGSLKRTQLAVSALTLRDLWHLSITVGGLEGLLARELALRSMRERRGISRQLKHQITVFGRLSRRFPRDFDRLIEAHNGFHECLTATTQNNRLLSALASVRPQIDRYEYVYGPVLGPDFTPTLREHGAIVRAVTQGTADEIELAVRANWWNSATRLASVIEASGS